MANASPGAVLTNIFVAPAEAFTAIKERPSPWLPLLVLLVGYCAVSFLYLNVVDLPWLMDRQMQNAPGDVTAEQRAQAVEVAARISPMVYGALGALSSIVSILAVFALVALYYTGVSFASNNGIKFKQWFAFIAWSAMPVVLGLVASLVNLMVSDARFLPQESLNPLSFGNLLAIDSEGTPLMQRILLSLDITTMWSIVLQVFGYQMWTQRSLVTATVVVLGPLAGIVLLGVLATL